MQWSFREFVDHLRDSRQITLGGREEVRQGSTIFLFSVTKVKKLILYENRRPPRVSTHSKEAVYLDLLFKNNFEVLTVDTKSFLLDVTGFPGSTFGDQLIWVYWFQILSIILAKSLYRLLVHQK